MRALLALVLAAGLASAAPAQQLVDLNAPGVLEALRIDNPAHYAKVRAILTATEERPSSQIREWMRTRFDASDIDAAPLWHVSDPPKIKLSFTLDKIRYTAMVVGRFTPAQAVPAR
jgi:hypothetical protein